MGVRRNFSRGGQSRHFAYLFQFVSDPTQMEVHKKKMSSNTATLHTVFSLKEHFTMSKCFNYHGFFETELAEFEMNNRLCEFLECVKSYENTKHLHI